jgi:c-di-AMP phosphodiesterase-like protein
MDLLTSFGTMLWYPLDFSRFSMDMLYIIDVWILGFLLFVILMYIPFRKYVWAISKAAVLLLGCYIAFAGSQQFVARGQLAEYASTKGLFPRRFSTFPQPLSPTKWLGIIETQTHYHQVWLNSITGTIYREKNYPKQYVPQNIVSRFNNNRSVKLFYRIARYPLAVYSKTDNLQMVEYIDLSKEVFAPPLPERKPILLRVVLEKAKPPSIK